MGFVANFILFLAVKKLWGSVKVWPSYSKLNFPRFLGHSAKQTDQETVRSAVRKISPFRYLRMSPWLKWFDEEVRWRLDWKEKGWRMVTVAMMPHGMSAESIHTIYRWVVIAKLIVIHQVRGRINYCRWPSETASCHYVLAFTQDFVSPTNCFWLSW